VVIRTNMLSVFFFIIVTDMTSKTLNTCTLGIHFRVIRLAV
jgi:hypothetical protein